MLEELRVDSSVEKLVIAGETRQTGPTGFKSLEESFGPDMEIETIPHAEVREEACGVNAIVRTGDVTAYSKTLLVSGACGRWQLETEAS